MALAWLVGALAWSVAAPTWALTESCLSRLTTRVEAGELAL
jgi:hypothetical protein